MKKTVLVIIMVATIAWSVRAATEVEKTGKAAEAETDVGLKTFAKDAPAVELIPDPAKVTFEKFESPEGKFSASVPAGWDRITSYPYKIDDKVNGIMLQGPENMEGAPMTISVLHYAGTGSIDGPQNYIRMVLSNPTRTDADQEIKFTDFEVAGIKGTTFTFKKFHLVMLPFDAPPMKEGVMYEMAPPTRKVNMTVRYVVIRAKKGEPAFYSFSYEAPDDMYGDFSPVFDTVVNSFVLEKK